MSERLAATAAAWAVALAPVAARGEPPGSPELPETSLDDSHKAAAQALFEEGRRLLEAGELERACHDFAESQRLDPALGTRFNLADCYEQLGKLASAWANFVGVADAADRLGQFDRANVARARADALEPRLSRLRLEVREPVAGLSVTRNGTAIGPVQWDKDVPIDAGDHTIVAQAPGHEPWETRVTVDAERGLAAVVIPPLVAIPTAPRQPTVVTPDPPSAAPPAAPDRVRITGQHIAGIVLGSAGVVSLGVGIGFGVVAIQKQDDADPRCPADDACFADGAKLLDEARVAGNVSTATLVVGGVLLATGVILLATAKVAQRRRNARARLGWSPSGAALRF